MTDLKVIGFDADDTLWINENYFREAESAFCEMLSDFADEKQVMETLFKIEIRNLELYGFGIKGFTLSMIECATEICGEKLTSKLTSRILCIGQEMLDKPVILLDKVEEILQHLKDKYRIILVTKGDLLDQHRKLEKSGLEKYFHHIEVMNNKSEADYSKLVKHLDIIPDEFLMIGNSLKSDVIPVLNVGAHAIYVPYEITWQHEVPSPEVLVKEYVQVESLHDILEYV
ncbi:HAD family hydrolase [Fulvivirga ligni]|uniref:HAD family hydrolase n=1 Tax=Fulvivirga ligni TaxID=2904246 RepID=UPI001F4740C9|nr:HAD family hydrolase [Fulvivirga ligni]UII22380.1 HAD family hydrolase [Fulvivirga ligni]